MSVEPHTHAETIRRTDRRLRWLLAGGVLAALLIAGIVSSFASSSPDGLEKVAADEGFLDTAKDSAVADSPLADYGVDGVKDERLSTGLAGVLGVGLTLLLAGGLFLVVRNRRPAGDDADAAPAEPRAGG